MTDNQDNQGNQTPGAGAGLLWSMIALICFVLGLVLGLNLNNRPAPTQSSDDELNRLLQRQLEMSISENLPPINADEPESE